MLTYPEFVKRIRTEVLCRGRLEWHCLWESYIGSYGKTIWDA